MRSRLDNLMLAVAAAQAVGAVLLFVRAPFVVALWPFPGTTELTFIFLAAILAAAAASTAWAALAGEPASYPGIALDYLAIFGPLAVYLLLVDPSRGGGIGPFWLVTLLTVTFGAWLLWQTLSLPRRDARPTPRPLRIAFAVFIVVLLLAGGTLVLGVPNILPWQVTAELSVVAGLIFLGAAAYFSYALVRPGWTNAGGQLAGFLIYDLVLVVPFLARLPTVPDQWRASLIGYLAVLIVSGAIAVWYLLVDPTTARRPAAR